MNLLALVIAMLSNTGWLTRSVVRDFQEEVQATDRFVDIGVVLHIVERHANGVEMIPGKPRLREVRQPLKFGGIIDTKAERPRRVASSANPAHWFCSPQQLPIVLHDTPLAGHLVEGGMGAGKTTCGVQWTYFRWLEHLGLFREGGITAPTNERLDIVLRELFGMFPTHWYRYQSSKHLITMCDGTTVRGVSTYQQSDAQGSRVQGYNWSWLFGDELQDQIGAFVDAMARLRSGREGGAPRYASATAKDSPAYRDLKTKLKESGVWRTSRLIGPDSPFVHVDHWDAMRRMTSKREYERLVLAMDLPSEDAVYPAWSRETNLITPQDLGWSDVTRTELRASGPNYTMLVGHDPGLTVDVSLFLRAYVNVRDEHRYRMGQIKPFWVVLGELTTEQSTTEHHIKMLLERVRDEWQLNLLDRFGRVTSEVNQILVRADPAGNNDNRTDKSVYTQFSNAGIRIRPAAYNAENTGHGRVPREAGVELVNMLLCNAAEERRLFVARNADGMPAAPMLVKALESAERDEAGRAETSFKKKNDVTHWPAALRYALWAIERPRLQLQARHS